MAEALPHSLWELLSWRATRSPDAPMLLDPTGRSLGFADVRDRAERVAAGLASVGVGTGTRVTWQLPTRVDTVIVSLALCRLGAVQNPIIHLYREREVGSCLRQIQPELVLTPGVWNDFDHGAMVRGLVKDQATPPRVLEVPGALPEGDPAALAPFQAPSAREQPVRWIYTTSGTTSEPKGVCHTDASLIAAGAGLATALGMSARDVGSIGFPYAHIGGPDYVIAMLASGCSALLMERFVASEAVELFRRHRVTLAGGSTAFYSMLLNEQRAAGGERVLLNEQRTAGGERVLLNEQRTAGGERVLLNEQRTAGGERAFPTLRALAGGGAPLPPSLAFEVRAELGIPIAHGYGMTECPMIAQGRPTDDDEQLAHSEGAPVEGCRVSIVLPDEREAPAGVQGEVRVAGPMLFRGYTDPRLDAEAFDANGRFRTGDLGMLRPDGHVALTGRLKDLIIRKGENISAQEVEDVLASHPRVAAVAVVGLPDPERGERVCAVVEGRLGEAPLGFAEMVDHCRSAGLMTQKIPEQLEIREALPRNATMKIRKAELRAELTAGSEASTPG